MKVKIKKLDGRAVIPKYAKDGDAGLDLVAISYKANPEHGYIEYGTGLAIEIPKGYVGYVFPRSSISKIGSTLANSVGVIDSGYRGEIKVRMKPDTSSIFASMHEDVANGYIHNTYEIGDKIAQLVIMPIPTIELEEVDVLSDSERGDGGFGSSDEKAPSNG